MSIIPNNSITSKLIIVINQLDVCLSQIKEMLPNCEQNNNEANNNVSSFILSKIDEMESHLFLNKGKPYASNSIHNWIKFQKVWDAFEKQVGKRKMTFNDITISTYYEFMNFCDALAYRNSTKCLYATLLKAAINYAYIDGISHNTLFANRCFKTHISYDCQKIYLTSSEIEQIVNLPLIENSTLDKVRDVFLMGCYTGQRFSDYSSMTIEDLEWIHIDDKQFQVIKKKQMKTRKEVIIPIMNKGVISILTKWGGKLPYIPISTFNLIIKRVCKMAGITDRVKLVDSIGGKEIEYLTTKDRLISSHTARRSCITNLYLEGKLDIMQIRSISGHKSEQSFNRYLCYSKEECVKNIIKRM